MVINLTEKLKKTKLMSLNISFCHSKTIRRQLGEVYDVSCLFLNRNFVYLRTDTRLRSGRSEPSSRSQVYLGNIGPISFSVGS